jgi:hypothetical protein
MKISGFTMVRNATRFYFPVRESILSMLPIVDEFIVALGEGDADDTTEQEIRSINSPKIKIFHRKWDEQLFVDGHIFREETNFAMDQCSGDWCFYLQADEVVHEKDHEEIVKCCARYREDPRVDGFLFRYLHFWGDYDHYLPFHGWYRNEIRIVRNHKGIRSYKDAQSFRHSDGSKLNVMTLQAQIYHYGWVRPPHLMVSKKKEQHSMHHGKEEAEKDYGNAGEFFNYGPLGRIPVFPGTHPAVMEQYRSRLDWKPRLDYGKQLKVDRKLMKHEKLKYKLVSFIENVLLGGRELFGYSNWKIVRKG